MADSREKTVPVVVSYINTDESRIAAMLEAIALALRWKEEA